MPAESNGLTIPKDGFSPDSALCSDSVSWSQAAQSIRQAPTELGVGRTDPKIATCLIISRTLHRSAAYPEVTRSHCKPDAFAAQELNSCGATARRWR